MATQVIDYIFGTFDVKPPITPWKSVLDSMLGLRHSGPELFGLPCITLLIVAFLIILIMIPTICACRKLSTWKRTVSRFREEEKHKSEMLPAEQSQEQQLEGKIKTLEQEPIFLPNVEQDVELQSAVVQEKVDSENLCENTGTSLSSDSEHREEQEPDSNPIFKMQMEFYKKLAEDNLMSACIAQQALAAERTETENLRQKIAELNTQLAESQSPAHAPPVERDCIDSGASGRDALENKLRMEELQKEKIAELEKIILKMVHEQAALKDEKADLQELCETLQEKCQVLENQSHQREQAEQERLSERQVLQRVREIRAAEPQEDVRIIKLKIQEMNEQCEKMESSLKKQVAFQLRKVEETEVNVCASKCALDLKRKEYAELLKKRSEAIAKVPGSQEPLDMMSASCLTVQPMKLHKRCEAAPKKTTRTISPNNKPTLRTLTPARSILHRPEAGTALPNDPRAFRSPVKAVEDFRAQGCTRRAAPPMSFSGIRRY